MYKIVISIVFFCFCIYGNAQKNKSSLMCALGSCEEEKIDTNSIDHIHRYQTNIAGLGNIGLPDYSINFTMNNVSLFRWSKILKSIPIDFKEYHVKKPYTNIAYMLGSKKEQRLSLLHTQNITRQANFSFSFHKDQSEGFYLNQATNNIYLHTNIWFKTKKENYKASLSGYHIRIFNEHNGGIVDDSTFENDVLLNRNRELMNVNLSIASSKQKKSGINLDQYYYFVNKMDSLNKGTRHGLFLNGRIENQNRVYKDSILNTDYYSNIYLDSTETKDTVQYWSSSAKIGYTFERKESGNVLFAPYFSVENIKYNQMTTDTFILVSSVGGLINFEQGKLLFNTNGDYYLEGYRKNNYNINSTLGYHLDSNWNVKVNASYSDQSPSVDSKNYSGNHRLWNNNTYTNSQYLCLQSKLHSSKYRLNVSVAYNNIYNPVYFNSISLPQQIEGVAQIIQTDVHKAFKWKKWLLDLEGLYQYSGGYNLFQLPEYIGVITIAKEMSLFKNNLHLYAGIDATYFSSFNAMNYNPEINQFYLSSEKKIGNYPVVDVFINGRIQSVRFFIKSSHVNAGLLGYKYYGAYHYPLKDRNFQFGINWSFIN